MNRISEFLRGVVFKRIVIIFVVGLVSRSLVNIVYDINVFKDYTTSISLMYYVFMACFTGFLQEFPNISLNAFKFNIVKSAITTVASDMYYGGKIPNQMFISNEKYSVGKISESSLNSYFRRPPAGIVGLYSRDNNANGRDFVSADIKHSLGNKLRCRIIWHG